MEEYHDLTQSKTDKDSKGIPRTLTSTPKSLFPLLNRSPILPPPISSPNPVTLSSPRIQIFSGEEKNDSSFEVWKFEVKGIFREKNYSTPISLQSIWNSLKGKARSLLLSLSEEATPEVIIYKLEGVFGNVYDSEAVIWNEVRNNITICCRKRSHKARRQEMTCFEPNFGQVSEIRNLKMPVGINMKLPRTLILKEKKSELLK